MGKILAAVRSAPWWLKATGLAVALAASTVAAVSLGGDADDEVVARPAAGPATTTTSWPSTTTAPPPSTTVATTAPRPSATTSTSTTTTTVPPSTTTQPPRRSSETRLACRSLGGSGTRSDPYPIPPVAVGQRLVLEACPGFPLGQGEPDFFLVTILASYPADGLLLIDYYLTNDAPAEITMVLDDLGPFALNIRGNRHIDGSYVQRWLRLGDVAEVAPGQWYLRTGRLNDVSSSPDYNLLVDLSG